MHFILSFKIFTWHFLFIRNIYCVCVCVTVWLCACLLMPVPQCACGVWKTTFRSWFSLFTSFLRPSLLFLLCCVLQASRPTGSSSLFSSHLVTGPMKLEMRVPHSAFSVASWVWTLVLRLLWQARYLLRHIDVSSKHFFFKLAIYKLVLCQCFIFYFWNFSQNKFTMCMFYYFTYSVK